ncbi:hypothetical protein [Halobacterium salinarum]|uniref:Uncharacterized protein n=1 Tax=Halobacterium salinarum (strain ATCC 33171 / DSM 3754 / JCM 8978 / NBRC 102687 / NCIMB 764 / 91-R6) TaxID=2597657 RepID=A0A4D6GUS7_HALS9|nr:hypothetical protein [Halobacterium salinarum]QCC44866.1 uncharacterized protein HBSAL_06015 [Halobacterium salinarum]TYO75551.1 hypothetical protein APQ99_01874 [Halobacterium salinarum DSM 3754]
MGRLRQLGFLLGIASIAYVLKKGLDDTVDHSDPVAPADSGTTGEA